MNKCSNQGVDAGYRKQGTWLLVPTLGGNPFLPLKKINRKKIGDGGGTGLDR